MPNPFDPAIVLARPLIATLGTLSEQGAPCTSPVWYHWEKGALFMLGDAGGSNVRRMMRDARASVEITDFDASTGKLLHLGLRGTAEILPMESALFRRLLLRYLGPSEDWNPWFIDNIARIDDPAGRLIRLAPQSIFTNNVSYFRSGPDVMPAGRTQ